MKLKIKNKDLPKFFDFLKSKGLRTIGEVDQKIVREFIIFSCSLKKDMNK